MAVSEVFNNIQSGNYLDNTRLVAQAFQAEAQRRHESQMQDQEVQSKTRGQNMDSQDKANALAEQSRSNRAGEGLEQQKINQQGDQYQQTAARQDYQFNAGQKMELARLGIDERKLGIDERKEASQMLQQKAMQEAAKGGIGGIRNYLLANGDAKGALELDNAQLETQNKVYQGQKTLQEIQGFQNQKDAGQQARFLMDRTYAIMDVKDENTQKDMFRQLAYDLKDKGGPDYTKLSDNALRVVLPNTAVDLGKQAKTTSEGDADKTKAGLLHGLWNGKSDPSNKWEQFGQDQLNKKQAGGPLTYDPETKQFSVGDSTDSIGKVTQNTVEGAQLSSKNNIQRLEAIRNIGDPELLTLGSKVEQGIAKGKDSIGISSEDDKALIAKAEKFIPKMERALMAYVVDVAKSTFTETLVKGLRDQYVNKELSPTTYVERMQNIIDEQIDVNKNAVNNEKEGLGYKAPQYNLDSMKAQYEKLANSNDPKNIQKANELYNHMMSVMQTETQGGQ